MFRAPKVLLNQIPYVLLGFKLHIYTAVFVSSRYIRIYILLHKFSQWFKNIRQKSLKIHMFRAPQALLNQFPNVLLVFKLHMYILPCFSLQDLSEYIYFCTYFLNGSRTFVKKNSEPHVSCTSKPFKFNFCTF
jgi:hypothetical protein